MPKKQKQPEVMPTEAEAEKSYQDTLYEQSFWLLEQMTEETRQRFFARLREEGRS